MPVSQGGNGRDHNPKGFLVWMTGAGIRGGISHGETDEIGYRAAKDPVTVHDLHATMLHLLGMDHKRLTYLHNGRRYRLTDVAGDFIWPGFAFTTPPPSLVHRPRWPAFLFPAPPFWYTRLHLCSIP